MFNKIISNNLNEKWDKAKIIVELIGERMAELRQPICYHVCFPKYMSNGNLYPLLKPWVNIFNNIGNLPWNGEISFGSLDDNQIVSFYSNLHVAGLNCDLHTVF